VGGLTAALCGSECHRWTHNDGQGCYLDVSMLEASLSAMGWAVSNYLVAGVAPGRWVIKMPPPFRREHSTPQTRRSIYAATG
jgi:crotonobetainyl-CoA:carnitine CoA-transferase CaiB-like acyl-CoA transferase